MAALDIFTEATQQQILNELRIQNSLVSIIANSYDIESWAAVQELVRGGGGSRYFPVGTQLQATHATYGTIVFDVVGHNQIQKPGAPDAPTMTLLMNRCIYGRPFDGSELLWANNGDGALPAGTYHLTLQNGAYGGGIAQDGTYQFTTTQPIPVGGGFRHSVMGLYQSGGYTVAQITAGTFTTYGADGATIESGLVTTEGTGGTDLGTASRNYALTDALLGMFNSTERNAYGSNHWGESCLRQWLNADEAANAWWAAQTAFDRAPSYANVAGFLNGLDADFVAVIGAVDIETAHNAYYNVNGELSGGYTTRDKFFLASMRELGWGNNNNFTEGIPFTFYEGAENTDRIKYDIAAPTTARYWWLRSPYPSSARNVRTVGPDGSLGDSGAHSGHGAAAACVIY